MSILVAMLVDRWLGEPPTWAHPVAWMGSYLKRVGRNLPARVPKAGLLLGAAYWLVGASLVGLAFAGAALWFATLPGWLNILLTGVLLKPLFALRMLLGEVRAVERALEEGLEPGRARLSHIVSRDTTHLDGDQIRESLLESLSENLSDSVIAPLLWFAIFGLPGAAVYRFANTADAMWGYRGHWEWAGKFAARADDLFNLIPARLTAVGLALASLSRMTVLRALPREAARTASPNSGWPMSAMALSLGVRLRKPGVYALNPEGRPPTAGDVTVALRRTEATAWCFAILLVICWQVLPRLIRA